jgi:hypothetical protein
MEMTPEDIEKEWTYRYLEALGIGRNESRAKSEADEWKGKVAEDK